MSQKEQKTESTMAYLNRLKRMAQKADDFERPLLKSAVRQVYPRDEAKVILGSKKSSDSKAVQAAHISTPTFP